jgi:leucyl aminopeptidase
MADTPASLPVVCTSDRLAALETDVLVVPWFEGDEAGAIADVDGATGGEVARAIAAGEFRGRPYDFFVTRVTDTAWRARRLALVGAGSAERFGPELARRLAVAAGTALRQRRVTRAGWLLRSGRPDPSGHVDLAALAQAVTEGLTLSEFNAGSYKTEEPEPPPAPHWRLALPEADGELLTRLGGGADRGRVLGECSNLARELANEPGNRLTPREFARRAEALASAAGVSVEVLDENRISELGMGLLLGVARGSAEPPRLIVFRYEPSGAPAAPVLGLVGKGITFDTGGISIKPADGMERMKDDMAGGAAVACAMRAIGLLRAPIRVVGVVPTTENMPGGRAIKPGDVLKSASGKTIEVINTDAEGRLILGDALWYARELGATHIVDVATLTGGCVVALGKITSGLFGSPDAWVEQVRHVANRAGDQVWPLPLFDEYRDQLKSEIADLMNTGGRPASSITAAMFLKEFTGGVPWAHLDIAGTAWADEARPYLPKGPSGVAVRTLAELAFSF